MTYQLATNQPPSLIRPMQAYDDRPGYLEGARDFAGDGKFSIYALERMLHDCIQQPAWRLRAKVCAAYYDGKQLDELRRMALMQEDLDERVVNLIRPIINGVLGQEAKSRTDVKIECDDDDYQDVAAVISARLTEAIRETKAHMAVSNAYASMVKKGIGWLHVCRNADPAAYPYRFEDVSTDEIWWDWRGQKGMTLDDRCRWLCRMRMVDLDELEAAMPEHRAVLERAVNGWSDNVLDPLTHLGEPDTLELASAYENESRFNLNFSKWDWIDSARKMVKLIEVWYRVPAMGVFLQLSPTRRVAYNPHDQRHVQAVARGLVKVIKGPTSQVRRALYAGPHRLYDEPTTRKRFPYVPMFAYRDDADGSPYGLIDGMIAPQDDYNDRRHRIQWMLKARQLFIDNDALDTRFNTIAEIADNVNRPDLVAVLKATRKNGQHGLRIENTLALQKEQFDLLERSEGDVQKAAGRYASQLGDAQVQSGIANSILVEQGEQAMGEMNDNYTTGRHGGFDNLVSLITEDHAEPNLRTTVGQGSSRRVVVLNTWQPPTQQVQVAGQDGQPQTVEQPIPGAPPMPVNMVADAEIRTGLGEVPNTPAYRSQLRTELGEVIKGLAGNGPALAVITPVYIEATNLENRQEIADDLRRSTGQPTGKDKKAREASAAQAQQAAAASAAAEQHEKEGKADAAKADARLKNAQADKEVLEVEAMKRKLAAGGPEAEVAGEQAALAAANDPNAQVDDVIKGAMKQVA